MSQEDLPTTRNELVARIRSAYQQLEETLRPLSIEQLERPGPHGGWAIRDHLAHLAEWRRKLLALMMGSPGSEGLQIDPSIYQTAGIDAINELLYQRNRARAAKEVMDDLREIHDAVLVAVEQMQDADLNRPNDLNDLTDQRRLVQGIAANTYQHDLEHRGWILEILKQR